VDLHFASGKNSYKGLLMGVLLTGFYWNCPSLEECEGRWYRTIKAQLPSLAADGFTAWWLPHTFGDMPDLSTAIPLSTKR
jgi:hypothetical protein